MGQPSFTAIDVVSGAVHVDLCRGRGAGKARSTRSLMATAFHVPDGESVRFLSEFCVLSVPVPPNGHWWKLLAGGVCFFPVPVIGIFCFVPTGGAGLTFAAAPATSAGAAPSPAPRGTAQIIPASSATFSLSVTSVGLAAVALVYASDP